MKYMDTFQLYTHITQCTIFTNVYGKKIQICQNSDDCINLKFSNPMYKTWDHWKYMEPINEINKNNS